MSDSIRLRKAKAIYDHALLAASRLKPSISDAQEIDDATLAVTLASLDLEAAKGQEDAKAALLKRADDLLNVADLSDDWQVKVGQWRSDLWAMALPGS